MRVTNPMMSNRLLTNVSRNLGLLNKYNTQASTGKKIQVASDDPIIAGRSLKFRTMLSEAEQYSKNNADAKSWLDATEAVFINVNNIITDMKGLCTRGANDTLTLEDRKKVMTEYMSLVEQLEQELNSDYMGRSLFSGFRTDKKPIIKDANGKNIQNPEVYGNPTANPKVEPIDGQYIEVQVGSGVNVPINILATDIYDKNDYVELRGGTHLGPNGAKSTEFERVLEFLNSPKYENMTEEQKLEWENDPNNDVRGMFSKMLTTLDNYQSKIATLDTEVGVRAKRVELVGQRLEDDKVNYKEVMSKNEDVDIAEVMMNFNTANAAYMASLNVGMKITQTTLADYLR